MNEFKLDDTKEYVLKKVLTDGNYRFMTRGPIHNPDATIKLGQRVIVGHGLSDIWNTSFVVEIIKIHKGVKFETENSTYILEEYEPPIERAT